MGCDCGKPGRSPQRVRIVKGKMVYLDDEAAEKNGSTPALAIATPAPPPTSTDTTPR